jgi:hypothetical protein
VAAGAGVTVATLYRGLAEDLQGSNGAGREEDEEEDSGDKRRRHGGCHRCVVVDEGRIEFRGIVECVCFTQNYPLEEAEARAL